MLMVLRNVRHSLADETPNSVATGTQDVDLESQSSPQIPTVDVSDFHYTVDLLPILDALE